MNIGKAIQLCRTQRRMSLAVLAKHADLSSSYLSLLENSKRDPTLSTIEKIAGGLRVPVEILFFLGADQGDLTGMDQDLAGKLAVAALGLLNEDSQAA